MTPLKVTAEMSGPAADYLPQLDALLIEAACHAGMVPREKIPTRRKPAPDPLDCPDIPLLRREVGGWPVFCCSLPIARPSPARTAHFGKRIETSRAGLLDPAERRVVVSSNTWTKSYRLPVSVLTPPSIVYFAVGDAAGLRDLLNRILQVGRIPRHGWGRVKRWRVEGCDADYSWYAPDADGRRVLMRHMPLCPDLPGDLDGWRQGYGAVCPPYWHSDRHTERVEPC